MIELKSDDRLKSKNGRNTRLLHTGGYFMRRLHIKSFTLQKQLRTSLTLFSN